MPYGSDLFTGGTPSGGTDPTKLFDDLLGDFNQITEGQYYQYQLAVGGDGRKLRMYSSGNDACNPSQFTLKVSNTGAFSGEEVTLLTVTSVPGWGAYEWKEWEFSNGTDYTHYRVIVTQAQTPASPVRLLEMELLPWEADVVPVKALTITVHAPSFFIPVAFIPVAALVLTGYAPSIPRAIPGTASIEIRTYPPVSRGVNEIPAAGAEVTSYAPTWTTIFAAHPPLVALEIAIKNPAFVWNLNAAMRPAAQVIYFCILTGANESPVLDDLYIPISSFQARIRNGEPSYLSCVIPNPTDYVDEITARSSGEIIIQKGYRLLDGSVNMSEIVRVDYETLAIDQGARSASGTIVGHKTVTATAAKEWTVQGVSFYGLQHDGKRRFRASMDLFLRPGDVAIYGSGDDDSLIVGTITYIVNTRDGLMEVTEA